MEESNKTVNEENQVTDEPPPESENGSVRTNTDGFSFNGCQKDMYEKLAETVLYCTPAYTSLPKDDISSEKEEELLYFYHQYKRRFYDRRSLKRPIYNVKLDQEGHVVHDENGIPILLVNSYVQGQLKSTKQLLYREGVEDVLKNLHCIEGVAGEDSCLPGGVNALSRLFNERFVFKGIFNIIRAFLAQCSLCQVNNPLPMRVLPPPVPIRSFRPHSRLQCDLIDMAPKKHRSFMQDNKWGYRYVLTVKCCFSKFCWLFPLKTKSAEEVYSLLKALFIKEGPPTIIQSDNGGEFIGEVVQKLCQEFEVGIIHGRPHHPQSQGQIENLNKQVKRLLARFLQRLPRDLQANVWPLLLSAVADLLNSKWHSTINDVPFRIYKNREPSCLVNYIIPDDTMWTECIEDGCLQDYEFSFEDFVEFEKNGQSPSMDRSKLAELANSIVQISSESILLSSLGASAKELLPAVKKIVEGHWTSSSSEGSSNSSAQEADATGDFRTESVMKYLFNLSEEYQSTMINVLEATEHTIQKNHKRSLKRAKEREFKVGDKVLFQNPCSEGLHFAKPDPFQPLNVVGNIKEVLPGGMYKVEVECEGQLITKSIFSGQMVLFKEKQDALPLPETSPKLSLLNLHNFISDFGLTVRKEMYDKGLRSAKGVSYGSIDDLFKSYCQVLDYGLLAMVSSFSGKEEEKDALHQRFVLGFRYFLYGTIYWERERKQNLGSSILSQLTSYEEHSDCLSCVEEPKQAPCFHPCCQNLVLQMAINCGLFCQRKDGHVELPDGSVLNTSSTSTKATPTSSSQASVVSSSSARMQDVTAGTGKGNSGHEQFNDASAGAGTKGCNSSQGNQKGNLSVPDQLSLISSANVPCCQQKQQLTLFELKAECLQHLESINVQGGELAEFVMPLRVYLADSNPSQDDATERRNLCYFLKIINKHANKGIQGQVHISGQNCNQENPMQVQGYSSFCGLCAMNNAIGISNHGPPLFDVCDLDLAADIMWLKQICEISYGFSAPSEPMRCLDGDYSILAMEEAANRKNCTFQRLDVPLKALVDGAVIQSLDLSSLHEFYSLVLGLFRTDEKPALIVRTQKYHFVTVLFKQDSIVLLDSQRTSAVQMSIRDGLGFLQREAYQNPDFAAVNLQGPGIYGNPVQLDDLPEVEVQTDFHCTLDEVWDSSSKVADDVIISSLHGQVKAKDLRTLKPGNLLNDVVINYIGSFLMGQKKNVYVASTFWLNRCSKEGLGKMPDCDIQRFEKFIFPIHCPGHWWCVLIDKPMKLYGEYDSLCKDRESDYVFQVLCNWFKTANIDISSFQRLSHEEREKMPSQGQNTSDCGVFMLGFISAFVNNIEMKFGLTDMPFLRSSFAKIIINGRPLHDCSNKCPNNHDSFHSADGEPGHMYQGDEDNGSSTSDFGSKECRKGMSPLMSEETTGEVCSGVGVVMPDSNAEGDYLDDTEDMEDDPFDLPPPLSPLALDPIDNDIDFSNGEHILVNEPDDDDHVLRDLLQPAQDAHTDVSSLEMLYSGEGRNVFQGLNPISEFYLHNLKKEKGKIIPRGFYHAAMTSEEMVDFDYWRQVQKGKSRDRFIYYKWDRALELWLKEASGESFDVQSIMKRVDGDGWVMLNIREQHYYEMWRDSKWRQLQGDD